MLVATGEGGCRLGQGGLGEARKWPDDAWLEMIIFHLCVHFGLCKLVLSNTTKSDVLIN